MLIVRTFEPFELVNLCSTHMYVCMYVLQSTIIIIITVAIWLKSCAYRTAAVYGLKVLKEL